MIDSVEIKGNSTIRGFSNVGGLVGIVGDGYLRKTSSVALVEENLAAGGGNFGGLVGYLRGMGTFIMSSYFRGTVNAATSENVGGIAGIASGGVVFSYAISNVSGNNRTGLFIGHMDTAGKNRVAFSFASPINADSVEGAFIGANSETGLVSIKFATLDPDTYGCVNQADSARCEEIELADNSQLMGNNFPYFDFVGTWNSVENDFPTLNLNGVTRDENALIQFEGSGTFDDPYQIKTTQDMLALNNAHHLSGNYFRIENDLDFTGVNFEPSVLTINGKNVGFAGVIDGNNKTIRNLSYVGGAYSAIFQKTYGLVIKNLTFENVNFSVNQYSSILTSDSSNLLFDGVFIKNTVLSLSGSRGGLFCAFCNNIAVKNSGISNSIINNTSGVSTGLVGLISGEMYNGIIYKSSIQGRINGFNRYVGGLVGQKSSYGRTIESFANVVITISGLSRESNGQLQSGFRVGGFFGSSLHRDYVYDSYSLGQIVSDDKILVDGVTPKDYYIGGITGSGHKFVHTNGFSYMNIDLDEGEHCGGLSGFQSNTHQAVNFLSASFGKCGSEEVVLEDGSTVDQVIPISYLGRGGVYATGNLNIIVRDYGEGGALCDNLDGDNNPIESFNGEVECQVVVNDDPPLENRFDFRGSAQQNSLIDDFENFGWDPSIWNTNNSGHPGLKWQSL